VSLLDSIFPLLHVQQLPFDPVLGLSCGISIEVSN
jgi:hypothetical protein